MNNEQFPSNPEQSIVTTSEHTRNSMWHNGMYALSVLFVVLALVIGVYTVAHRASIMTGGLKPEAILANEAADSDLADVATVAVIDLSSVGPTPDTITTTPGATVTWKNSDSKAHSLMSDTIGDNTVAPGASVSYTFDEPGNYTVKDGDSSTIVRVRE